MNFEQLLNFVREKNLGVCIDSRKVIAGDVFAAIKGTVTDGHNYIDQAISNGAKFIVCSDKFDFSNLSTNAEFISYNDTASAAGLLAQASYGEPAKKLTSLAVTGTNGKTTTAMMVRAVINETAGKCGLIGTIENDTCRRNGSRVSDLTTPDAISIAELMSQMVDNGAGFICMEASSHALEQRRLAGIEFKAAAFTNLTGDHLDYHKTMQAYLDAKSLLFEQLKPEATAILNKDDKYCQQIALRTNAKVIWYSIEDADADLFAEIKHIGSNGSCYDLVFQGKAASVNSSFCGRHNISNQLAAAGLCLSAGLNLEEVAKGLEKFKNVRGRLERVEHKGEFDVFVDYAHTDDALKNVLKTLSPICKGRLITVFGCGGDRDKTKRPRMAAVAQQYSDIVFVTSDNPRTEQPDAIINDILAGFTEIRNFELYIEPDRKTAISKAVAKAAKGDIILIAGKGHEDYQIIGTIKHHFDDSETAKYFLNWL